MKKVISFGVIIWLIIAACSRQDNKSLMGAWLMVQMQRVDGGKVTNYFSDRYKVNQIKMWSENHFIFVGKYEVDTLTSYRFGDGTYSLKGNLYVEDILYHFDKSYEKKKNKIWLEIRNDTLFHTFPVNDNGRPVQAIYWIEKYVRLK
jgi:hypothetical protein